MKGQILKKKNNFLIFRLLGIENCTFLPGNSDDIDARWHSWEDAWTKMVEVMGIVQTNCGKELMLACLRTYFYLREQRNQINHATAENVLRRTEIEMFLNNALAALSAASSGLQKEKM